MAIFIAWIAGASLLSGNLIGTLMTTLFYVFVGCALQFVIGTALAFLCSQPISGKNFFRVIFFIPLMITPLGVGGFCSARALSTRNDDPAGASRPWDKDRDGFVIGEGAGVLVLEEYEHAKARGARIYAEVVGYGATSDGYDMVAPSGEGAERCMKLAIEGVDKIDYINTHGTSTPVGDTKELEAIRAVFGNSDTAIASTKSLSGHALGAAGVNEAIYTLIMMENNFIAASANIENLDPAAEGMNIVRKRIDNVKIETALSNSFGFGGTNATLTLSTKNL
jgi:3-oxoacyl-[acyl-carrier-protein] synthase-1